MVMVDERNAAEAARAVREGTLPGPAKSLAEAMCRVMEQVGYVQKDKQMQGGGSYKYVSVEAVIDALRPEMIRQQLVLLPCGIVPLNVEHFEGKNGGRQNRTQVVYSFKLIHAPSGQSEPVVVIGEAIDVGDKSSNKAMTAARKYALLMAFNIETGLDPDDTPSAQQERAPARQPDANPPKGYTTPPAQQQAQKPAPRENPAVRAKAAQAFAQCKTRDDYLRVCTQVRDDVAAGVLTQADRDALAPVARETNARLPDPAAAK